MIWIYPHVPKLYTQAQVGVESVGEPIMSCLMVCMASSGGKQSKLISWTSENIWHHLWQMGGPVFGLPSGVCELQLWQVGVSPKAPR